MGALGGLAARTAVTDWVRRMQSNMWLVMHFDTSRNITYDKVMQGKYQNIRMHTTPHNEQSDDALEKGVFDFYTSPPPPAYSHMGGYPEGGWLLTSVGTYANKTCREGPYTPNMPDCTSCELDMQARICAGPALVKSDHSDHTHAQTCSPMTPGRTTP